ncbi:437_t:CDS:2, partial [Rhizophagus irregularis]
MVWRGVSPRISKLGTTATNELLNNKDFVDFLHNNFLYTNRPSFFKILKQAIKKHETAPQRLKHHTQDYLWETLTSLLERYDLYTPLPFSTPSSTPIVYKYPLAFPIHQVTRLPIRSPSNEFRLDHKTTFILGKLTEQTTAFGILPAFL